jgi:hypothetical protein
MSVGVRTRTETRPRPLAGSAFRLVAKAAAETGVQAVGTLTDALGGAAPIPIILTGGGRAVQGFGLKASGLSSRQVLTPRLPV